MSCIIENGLALGCASIGGVEKVWIGTYDATVSYVSGTQSIITALDNNDNDLTIYSFEQDIEYAGLEQTGAFSRENGTVLFESNLSVKFIELDAVLRNTILALAKAPVCAVVKSNAGHFYILGVESAGRATEGVASLGVAMGDMNGATLTLSWKSKGGAYLIDEDLLNFTGTPDPTKITVA